MKVTAGRGGEQSIPRPAEWSLGGPAPWAHLPTSARTVDLEVLSERLAGRVPGARLTGAPPPKRDSAVLIPLWDDAGEAAVILTRRTRAMRAHSGEVSFPGGGQDPGESLWETAVREAAATAVTMSSRKSGVTWSTQTVLGRPATACGSM